MALAIDPDEYRQRWALAADGSGPVLGGYRTVFETGSGERSLQATIENGSDAWTYYFMAPIDDAARIESVGVRSRLPVDLDDWYLTFGRGVLRQLIETTSMGSTDQQSDCLVRRLLPSDEPPGLIGIDRMVTLDATLEYRVLDVGGVLWLTASRVAGAG